MSGDVRRVLRWEIAVDDGDHEFVVDGPVLRAAACEDPRLVEFWTHSGGRLRAFRVFGTGQSIPAGYVWRATTERTSHGLVWHLFERVEEAGGRVTVQLDMAGITEDQLVMERLRGQVAAAEAIHFVTAGTRGPMDTNCAGCSHDWPCPTRRVLAAGNPYAAAESAAADSGEEW